MKKKIALILVVLAVILTACGARAAQPPVAEYQTGYGGGAPVLLSAPTMMPAMAYTDAAKSDTGGMVVTTNATSSDRLVIKNADLTIVVADPQAKMEAIIQMADAMGGFVVSSNMYQTTTAGDKQVPEGVISIRVPADQLDAALTQIKSDAVEVRSETQVGQDVTASYVDLQSQLRNLELAEQELQAIMEEAKNNPNSSVSSKTQDVLAVYNQIVAVRSQIEQIKGQMKYYEESSAYSLINVNLVAKETIQPIKIGPWTPGKAAREAIQTLIDFLQGFVDFLIWLVIFVLPMLIVIFGPIALIVWGIVRQVKRSRAKKAKEAGK